MVQCGAPKPGKKEGCKINVKPGERCRFHPDHIPGSEPEKVKPAKRGSSKTSTKSKPVTKPKPESPKSSPKSKPKPAPLKVIKFAEIPWLVNITSEPFELPLESIEILQKHMKVICYWNEQHPYGRKEFLRGDFLTLQEEGFITPNTYCFLSKDEVFRSQSLPNKMSRNFLVEKLGESGVEIAFASDGCCSGMVTVSGRDYVICNLEGKVFQKTVTLKNFGLIDDEDEQQTFAKIISSFSEFDVSKDAALGYFGQAKSDLNDKRFKGDYLHFGIYMKGVPAGYLYVRPLKVKPFEPNALHIRIGVSKKFQSQGIATQALSQFREISQKIKNPIYSLVDVNNAASNALMRKMGYELKTTIKAFGKDHHVYVVK